MCACAFMYACVCGCMHFNVPQSLDISRILVPWREAAPPHDALPGTLQVTRPHTQSA